MFAYSYFSYFYFSTMKIINKENNKTTVLSFWDRTVDIVDAQGLGWDTLNVVHIIGGLGVFMTPEEIQEKYNIPNKTVQHTLRYFNSNPKYFSRQNLIKI